jgi:hypothetical protein
VIKEKKGSKKHLLEMQVCKQRSSKMDGGFIFSELGDTMVMFSSNP